MENLRKYLKANDISIIDEDEDFIYCASMSAFHHAAVLTQLGYRAATNPKILVGLRINKKKEA